MVDFDDEKEIEQVFKLINNQNGDIKISELKLIAEEWAKSSCQIKLTEMELEEMM